MLRFALAVALVAMAGMARADMTSSPRPVPRPAGLDAGSAAPVEGAGIVRPRPRPALAPALSEPADTAPVLPVQADTVVRPMPRPAGIVVAEAAPADAAVSPAAPDAPRPKPRPNGMQMPEGDAPKRGGLAALFGKGAGKKPVVTDGYVCGDPDIRGDELAPILSRTKGCGIAEPVRVTSVDGVRLRGGATIDCGTAKALKTWIDKGMRPAFAKEVVELQIAASYVCRPRNNVRGNKISEHGRGKAVDIAAFVFADGSSWTVLNDYNRQVRKAHKAACGIFGTTLGPGSDGYHENHLHFDTAAYRSGPYCR